MGTDNAYPDIRLGSANGNNLAIATGAGGFSQSSLAGDMVLRSLNRLILQSGGGGYGILIDTSNKVFVNSGILNINAAEWSSGGSKGLIFRSGYDVPNNNNYNCSILTYDHLGDGFCDGLSINGWDGISFCTGANTRAERMRITNGGRIGVANTNPQSMLHLGNCEVINSAPVIVFGKNVNNVGFRNAFMGYTDSFFFVIGDYGSTNAGSNALTSQLAIIYNAPASSLVIQGSGYVQMQYGFGNGSDERIKSNIKTIENALDKTLLLRGVEFNLNIEPERKRIGLIAQEVELIVPEVVRTSEDDGLKSIEYQNLVGLLIESIKELNNKVSRLENIIIKNNLN